MNSLWSSEKDWKRHRRIQIFEDPTIPIEVGVLDRMIAVMRFLVVHFQSHGQVAKRHRPKQLQCLEDLRRAAASARAANRRTTSRSSEGSLPWYSYLRRQVRSQSGFLFYKCEVCGFLARDFDQFVEHRRNHFSGAYELQAQRTTVRKRAKKHTCPECHRTFTWLCHLKSHMRTHMGEKLLKCSECDFTSKDEAELAMHQKVHTWDRQFRYKEYEFGRSQSQTSLKKPSPDADARSGKGHEDDRPTKLTINLLCPPQSPNDESDRQQLTDNSKSSSRRQKIRDGARKPIAHSDSSRHSSTRGLCAAPLRS